MKIYVFLYKILKILKLTNSCSELGDTQIVPRFRILITTKFNEKFIKRITNKNAIEFLLWKRFMQFKSKSILI